MVVGLLAKSCPTLATPWTVARQAPLSMGFSRQEYWSALPFPSPEDLSNPGIEHLSHAFPTLAAECLAIQSPPWVPRAALGLAKPVKFQSYSFCDTVVPIWRDPEKLWVCTQ